MEDLPSFEQSAELSGRSSEEELRISPKFLLDPSSLDVDLKYQAYLSDRAPKPAGVADCLAPRYDGEVDSDSFLWTS